MHTTHHYSIIGVSIYSAYICVHIYVYIYISTAAKINNNSNSSTIIYTSTYLLIGRFNTQINIYIITHDLAFFFVFCLFFSLFFSPDSSQDLLGGKISIFRPSVCVCAPSLVFYLFFFSLGVRASLGNLSLSLCYINASSFFSSILVALIGRY